jgi:hypothetical protein
MNRLTSDASVSGVSNNPSLFWETNRSAHADWSFASVAVFKLE